MKQIILLTFLALGLGACRDKPKDVLPDPMTEPSFGTADSKYNTINLQFNNPTVLDSSDWVLYPLTLEELEETEKGFKSSSYGRQYAYWNVAFYNRETKQTRLLSDSLKMLINSISPKNDAITHSGQRTEKNQGLIYYSITTKDFNQDGRLNSDDPKYLFISDLSGQNFEQVSPDNFDLIHWQTISQTKKILIQARRDSNKDKKFDGDDETISFIYVIDKQEIEPVFSNEFNLMTKKLLDNQWTKKK
ncbi:hypothetical protein [Leeuwenhoekiella marinoflava]|uniref:hypothetical protein n=1 Tax=Leeuwenhoekiella marinoflava TaxID=988 RepID=UPI0030033F45